MMAYSDISTSFSPEYARALQRYRSGEISRSYLPGAWMIQGETGIIRGCRL